MKGLHELIFPGLPGRWGYVNLGEESYSIVGDPNPLLDPAAWVTYLDSLHQRTGIDLSYGGYLEDRGNLWRGHYMAPGCAWHLGIDFNVPVNTQVRLPFDAELHSAVVDPDQNGGWGGKAIFNTGEMFVIFGHLYFYGLHQKGGSFKKGTLIGCVAPTDRNGGWFPHLHVQCVRRGLDPETVDGYGSLYAGIETDFPRLKGDA